MRSANGGMVLALVGGDEAGTDCGTRELRGWLAAHLVTMHAPLRRPPRSLLSAIADVAFKGEGMIHRLIGSGPPLGTPIEMLGHLCTARARFRWYRKAQRVAVRGGVAICDGYPLPQNRHLLGPCIAQAASRPSSWWAELLASWERRYYDMILPPHAVCVLRVDPDSAVNRGPEEPDSGGTPAHVVDASLPFPDVLRELRNWVWSVL